MSILLLLIFISLGFTGAGLLALGFSLREGDVEHADRLALLPLHGGDEPLQKRGLDK